MSLKTADARDERFQPAADAGIGDNVGMNSLLLAFIAACPSGLVPIGQAVFAAAPTSRQASATATVLPSATVKAETGGGGEGQGRHAGGSQPVKKAFVDDNGFITTAASSRRHVIYVVDLP